MQIIGHRGSSYDCPENTLVSIKRAWQERSDAAEIDVHLSADRRIVVMHDASTARTTGVDIKISETDSSELRKLDAGSHKGSRFAGEMIPFLEEVLDTIPPGRRLFVEIKCGAGIMPILRNALDASGKRSQVVVICFDLSLVSQSKKLMPDVSAFWLRAPEKNSAGEWQPHSPELVEIAAGQGLDGLDLYGLAIREDVVEAGRSAGQQLYAWTVNDPAEARRLRDLGIDGLTTDRPGWMISQLATVGKQ